MTTIQDIRSSANSPQRAYEWEVEILGNSVTGQLPLLTARASNITIPSKDLDTIVINHKSRKTHYAGRDATSGTFTVQFWDDESGAVYDYFNNWIENGISNSVVGGGLTKDLYSVELLATLFGHDSTTQTGAHRFSGVWPSSLGDISLDYGNSDHVTFSVTFTYDIHTKE